MNPYQIAQLITEDPNIYNESDIKLRQTERQYRINPSLANGIKYLQHLLRTGQPLNDTSYEIIQSEQFRNLLENYFNPRIISRFPAIWDESNYSLDSHLTNELADIIHYEEEFGDPTIKPPYWLIKTENNEYYKYSSEILIEAFSIISDHLYGVAILGPEGTTIELFLSIPAFLPEIINYYLKNQS